MLQMDYAFYRGDSLQNVTVEKISTTNGFVGIFLENVHINAYIYIHT